MAEPIRTSEIIIDDNLDSLITKMKALEASVASLYSMVQKQEGAAAELEATTRTLNVTTAVGREQMVKAAKATDELERANKAYTKVLSDENAKIQELKIATATLTNLKKNEAKAALAAEGSYNKLSAQYSIIKLTLNGMSKAEREGTAEGQKLVKTANAIYQEMKRLQAETGKTALNVGNYAEATQGLNLNLGEMKKQLLALRNTSFAGKTEAEIAEINQRIGVLVDNMDDLRAQQKALGTEMSTLFVGSLKVVSAGVQGLVGTLSLLGVESEELQRLEKKMVQLIAVTHALAEIEDALQKKTIQTTLLRIQSGIANAKDTAVKWANVVATTAQARAEEAKVVALGRGNVLVRTAAAVQWAWNAALAANPIGLIVIAVAALAVGIYALVKAQKTETDEMRKAAVQRKVNNSLTQQAAINAVEEKIQVGNLIGILKSETATKREKKQAIEQINEIAPEYFKGLTIEKDGVEAIAKIYNEKYLPALAKRAKFEAANQRLVEIEKELLNTTKRLEDTKPGYFDAATTLVKNFGDKTAAAQELVSDWTKSLKENEQGLNDEKEAILNFIKSEDLATQILDFNTTATEKNTKAKKDSLTVAEQLAIEANKQLGFQNELAELLLKEAEENAKKEAEAIERALKAAELVVPVKLKLDTTKLTTDNELITTPAQLRAQGQKDKPEDLFDLLGFNFEDADKARIKEGFDFAKGQLSDYLAFRTEIANRNVANADREVQAAQEALNNEMADRRAGLANIVETRQKDFDDAKKRQEAALKQQEKVAKAERAIQTIQQATNLITGVSKLFAEKNILAIPLAALMIGSFIGFKLAAIGAAKKQFGEGGSEFIEGGSHASGDDTYLGFQSEGKPAYAERGEFHGIVRKERVPKYRSLLPEIINSLNKGTFEQNFQRLGRANSDIPIIVQAGNGSTVNTGRMESSLDRLVRQGEVKTYTNARGELVTRYRNLETIQVK